MLKATLNGMHFGNYGNFAECQKANIDLNVAIAKIRTAIHIFEFDFRSFKTKPVAIVFLTDPFGVGVPNNPLLRNEALLLCANAQLKIQFNELQKGGELKKCYDRLGPEFKSIKLLAHKLYLVMNAKLRENRFGVVNLRQLKTVSPHQFGMISATDCKAEGMQIADAHVPM